MRYHFLLFFALTMVSACQRKVEKAMPSVETVSIADSIDIQPIGLYSVGDMLQVEDGFIILDRVKIAIVKTNDSFLPTLRYDNVGMGPFEFQRPIFMTSSGREVFLIDGPQLKIIRFDLNLTPLSEHKVNHPPFSIVSINDTILWMGTVHSEFQDVYQININSGSYNQLGKSRKIKTMPESIVFHASNNNGQIARYRPFGNIVELFQNGSLVSTFRNHSQAELPEIDPKSPAPMFKSKTHNSAFVTESLACFLSGDFGRRRQPIQCFDFDGNMVSRYVIPTPSTISVYSDSLLYTYSPETNHIYVYDLGF